MNILAINIIFMIYLTGVSVTESTPSAVPTETASGNGSDATPTPNVYNSSTNLYKELLKNYDARVLPRKDASQPIDIAAIFYLQGVFELDTVSQRLSILGYYVLSWKDDILVWNVSLHGGIDKIKLPISQVWVPPLRLSVTYGGKGKIGDTDDIVEITSDGKSVLTTDNTYNIFCDVNIKFYPFDKHDCVFYVFVTQINFLDVNISQFTAELSSIYFKENTEWRVVRFRSTRLLYLSYVTIRMNLELERRHEFILFTTICPLVLLSVINVGVFLVPVNSGEKGSIAVTIFLSYSVFITTISEELPRNSLNISYILIYISLLLLLSVLAVVYSYIQSCLYDRCGNERVNIKCLRKPRSLPTKGVTASTTPAIAFQSEMNQTTNQNKTTLISDESTPETDHLTWNTLLHRLDLIVFVFMLFIVVTGTSLFFVFLSSGSNT